MKNLQSFKFNRIIGEFLPRIQDGTIPEGIEIETVPAEGLEFYAIMGSTFWKFDDVLIHKSNAQFGIFSPFCQDREPQIRAFRIDRPLLIEKTLPPFGEYKVTFELKDKQSLVQLYRDHNIEIED